MCCLICTPWSRANAITFLEYRGEPDTMLQGPVSWFLWIQVIGSMKDDDDNNNNNNNNNNNFI